MRIDLHCYDNKTHYAAPACVVYVAHTFAHRGALLVGVFSGQIPKAMNHNSHLCSVLIKDLVKADNGLLHLKYIYPLWKIWGKVYHRWSVNFQIHLPSVCFLDKVHHRSSKYVIQKSQMSLSTLC